VAALGRYVQTVRFLVVNAEGPHMVPRMYCVEAPRYMGNPQHQRQPCRV